MKAAFFIISFLLCVQSYAQEVTIPSGTKGGIVLVGTVSDAHADKDSLRFLFTGTAVYTIHQFTPQAQTLRWEVRALPVRASAWTLSPEMESMPSIDTGTFANIVRLAARRSEDHQKTYVGLMEPVSVTFEGFGEIKSIEAGLMEFFPHQ